MHETAVRLQGTRWRWLGCLLALLLAMLPPAAASGDLCGATIVADLQLDHDMTCPGTAPVVGADGITLDLNGHAVTGSGTGVGILVSGRTDVSIEYGTIRNFEAGVRILESTDVTVKGNELGQNTDGVDCQARCAGNTIKENDFRDNLARGIMLRSFSSDITVKDNSFSGNRTGVLLFGCVGCTVKDNTVSSSLLAGIRINVVATGNMIKENIVSSSPAGIEVLVTPTGSATGNSIMWNTLVASTCGLKGPLGGNRVRGNVFDGNATDICG